MLVNFDQSEGNQGAALGSQAGATAAIPIALRTGKSAVKTLNAIFRGIYKGNIEVITAWKTASHIQRVDSTTAPVVVPVIG